MNEKPTFAWYLFPIFFGIFGSLIVYLVLKDNTIEVQSDTKKMIRTSWIIGILVTVFGIIFGWYPLVIIAGIF